MKGLGREVQLNNALEVFNWMRPRANMQLDSATVAVMMKNRDLVFRRVGVWG